MTIPLHPDKGINPMMGYCPNCLEQNGEIILAGRSRIYTCRRCGKGQAGYQRMACECGNNRMDDFDSRPVEDGDKIMGGLCPACQKERDEHRAIVVAGGVYFECKCGARGVVLADAPLAIAVREQLKVPAPGACGVRTDECHMCNPNLGKEESEEGNTNPS
jgi:hypothetical protein